MNCPHCYSPDTVWKPKPAQWECNSCERRFDGDAPAAAPVAVSSAASPVPSRAARPLRIFFSYGHDHNRELVDRFKADLEARGHQVWIDYDRIGTWEDWRGKITKGIHEAQMAVAFLSVHSTRDPGVCRLLGICFLREAPERAIGSDRRAGKSGLVLRVKRGTRGLSGGRNG